MPDGLTVVIGSRREFKRWCRKNGRHPRDQSILLVDRMAKLVGVSWRGTTLVLCRNWTRWPGTHRLGQMALAIQERIRVEKRLEELARQKFAEGLLDFEEEKGPGDA